MFKGHSFDNGHFLYCFTFGCSIAVVSCSSEKPELVLTLSVNTLVVPQGAQLAAEFQLLMAKASGETLAFCFYLKNKLSYMEYKQNSAHSSVPH